MSDLVKYQAPDVMTLGTVLARSGYFQDARDAAQAVVKVLAGQELGFGPIASMTGIYIVKGRVSLSANLIAASVKRGKYNYRVIELSDTACKIDFYEGKEKIGESAFSMEDAKAAGLAFGDTWKKFPRNMLFARAMSNGAKWYCADVFGGPVYTPDELGAVVDGETGEMLSRPKDEVIAPPQVPGLTPGEQAEINGMKATVDAEAARLFPQEPGREEPEPVKQPNGQPVESIDRAVLIGKIRGAADKAGMTAFEKGEYKQKYLGGASVEKADVAALADMLNAIRARKP